MRDLTIKEAAVIVLKEYKKPMSVTNLCDIIIDRKLYDFGARSPKSVLRIELARASENQDYSKACREKLFKYVVPDMYELI